MVGGILKFNTFLENHNQLEQIEKTPIKEVILEHKLLSRIGRNNTKTLLSLLEEVLYRKLSPVLQWDILITENNFNLCLKLLKQLPLSRFQAIRVQDIGAAEWIRKEYPRLPLHLIVETGNHNLTSLLRWSEYFGKQLGRFVLSNELPKSKLIEYSQILKIPCEIMCVGRILLFYTPRKLLSNNNFSEKSLDFVEKNLFTKDQPKKIFRTLENQHGTFMFFYRDLFLLDFLDELKKTHLSVLRLDLRHLDSTCTWIRKFSAAIQSSNKTKIGELKSAWPCKITHGFFRANRTELAIERIKNPYLKDHGETLVGYIVEAIKGKHLILLARKNFSCGKTLLAITPEGRECKISTNSVQTINGVPVTEIVSENLYQVPHVKYVTPQTLIYSNFNS